MIGMKTGTSVLLVLTLLTLAVSASAYYNVSVISISPSGDISAGSTVTVNLILNFTAPTEKGSFNSSNNLNFVSDLRQPAWQMTLTTDGLSRATVEKTGSSVYYNGFSISQPPGVMESMTVVMKGTAPSSSLNGTINVLTIQESDEYNRAFPGTITTYSANLVSATPTSTPTTKPTTIATQETTVAPTSLPTTLPTTVVTATASPSPTATPDTGILQTIKSLPLMYIGIGILILVIILVVIILIVRRSREYEEDEEYEDANEEYDDEDYEDRPRR